MHAALVYGILIGAVIYAISLVASRFLRCPTCGKHAVKKVEGNRFWKRYSCRRCGNSFVEDH
jgi:transposase-like protein